MENKNNCVKYYIKGTLKGSRCYDNFQETIFSGELVNYLDQIEPLFTRDADDDLAQYIWEDEIIYGVVTEIWVGVKVIDDNLYSWTEVTANRQLTPEELTSLLDYLTGQFSDGYGEGLEQQEFATFIDTEYEEEWDEDEQAYYTEEYDVDVCCYLHLWQSDDFKLEIVKVEGGERNE